MPSSNLLKKNKKSALTVFPHYQAFQNPILYTHFDVRERIMSLRKQQEAITDIRVFKTQMTDESKDVLLATKNKRNRELDRR